MFMVLLFIPTTKTRLLLSIFVLHLCIQVKICVLFHYFGDFFLSVQSSMVDYIFGVTDSLQWHAEVR